MAASTKVNPDYLIEDETALRALFPPTHERAAIKCLDHLDPHAKAFISRSPFLCIGTQSPEGPADVSPRGDPNGFVKVLDDKTLLIPDRPGNNRLDTLSNLMTNPSVGLLFMIPGFDETLRINGTAQVSHDPALLDLMVVQDRRPLVAIVVTAHEMYLHCAKAFRRSKLWDLDARVDRAEMPSLTKMMADQIDRVPETPEQLRAMEDELEAAYKTSMY